MFPENLDCAEFQEAWELWVSYRKEIRKKITPTTQKLQLKKLSSWGVKKAILSIETSIENGWIGLFEQNLKEVNLHPASNSTPIERLPDLTPEEIRANQIKVRELISSIGKKF